jgi:tRNA(Ile)-lysidine synthase
MDPTPRSPSSDSVERFRGDMARLTGTPQRFGVAVSGGPDSLALLLLAAAAFPGRIAAATVDHGLRSESADEARFVGAVCHALGVSHAVLTAQVDTKRASLQRSAREARYAALGIWLDEQAICLLATAHHLDDQAETLTMRLLRGTGVAGLSGVRAIAPLPVPGASAKVVRPLLGWRRSELAAIVAEAGIAAIDDPSNRDPRHDRVRVRRHLAQTPWLDPVALARSAAALAEADEALDWTARRLFEERITAKDGILLFAHEGIPAELERRLLLNILASVDGAAPPPRGAEVTRLLAALRSGATATLAGIQCSGGALWTFAPGNPRRRSN